MSSSAKWEASLHVLPSMEGVLLIRDVDRSTGETILIDAAPSLREADDPFRWAALDDSEGLWLGSDSGCPKWMESDGRGHVFVVSALLWLENAFACVLDYLPAKEIVEEKRQGGGAGVVLFVPGGSHRLLVTGCPSSIKQWKESWFWVSSNWQRMIDDSEPDLDVPSVYGIVNALPHCELSRDVVDVVRSIYHAAPLTQRYGLILNRHRCLVELGLMASKAEMDQERHPQPTLECLTKQRPRILVPSSAEDTSQKKVIEDLSREENGVEVAAPDVLEVENSGAPEGDAPLKRKRKSGLLGQDPLSPRRRQLNWWTIMPSTRPSLLREPYPSTLSRKWFLRALPG
ncbi:Uncharacterized protein Adt_10184 [Abeliophyllum distichum]|uniref:Uncharacterized protein n=1 Tax=Abeliophyllum distichum TaxID=126358 RepID=A0ABD1UJG2_9LAMI